MQNAIRSFSEGWLFYEIESLMYYVYLLRSLTRPDKKYIGFITNLNRRFHEHNCGKSPYTARFVPWEIVTFVCFKDEEKARRFEKYLKSHSGRSFAAKHF